MPISTSEIIQYIAGLLGLLIVAAAGIMWQFKKGVAAWIKFISSLGIRKKEISDKDFLFYRIIGIIYIVIGGLLSIYCILILLSPTTIYKFWSLFY